VSFLKVLFPIPIVFHFNCKTPDNPVYPKYALYFSMQYAKFGVIKKINPIPNSKKEEHSL